MLSILQGSQRVPMRAAAALAIVAMFAMPAWAQAPRKQDTAADLLEKMARENFGALSRAESILVRAAPHRELPRAGPNDNPADPANDPAQADKWPPDRCIRAGLLAWLVSDSEVAPHIHPSGAGIEGARIVGRLDLSYQQVARPLTLVRCAIPDGADFSSATLGGLELRASRTGPIVGDLARIKGDLALRFGHHGPVSIYRASIGGDFDLTGSTFTGGSADEVSAVETWIGGDALFHQGFTSDGMVDFRLARIGHSVSFNDARFVGDRDNGLTAERAVVDGPLYWTAIAHTPRTALDLQNARVVALWDDRASWPAKGNLQLDGFSYGEFGGDSPADSAARLQWLALQPAGYHPQPYMELARVLRDSGRSEGSSNVLIAQRVDQRREGRLSLPAKAWNLLLEASIGYGYRPLRALWWMAAFVLVGTILFQRAYRAGLMTPADGAAFDEYARSGRTPRHYPRFNAFVYSLENLLPIVDLHQGNHWRPNARHRVRIDPTTGDARVEDATMGASLLRWYLWLHILAGWVLTPLMFAGLSGLIRVE